MPAARPVHPHPCHAQVRGQGTGPPEPHPPAFGDLHLTPAAGHPPHLGVPDHEPLRAALTAVPRSARPVLRPEKRRQRPVEIPQRLLLHRRRTLGQPRLSGTRLGQLPLTFRTTRCAPPARPPPRLLLNSKIPHQPGILTMAPQNTHLRRRRVQPVPDRHSRRPYPWPTTAHGDHRRGRHAVSAPTPTWPSTVLRSGSSPTALMAKRCWTGMTITAASLMPHAETFCAPLARRADVSVGVVRSRPAKASR